MTSLMTQAAEPAMDPAPTQGAVLAVHSIVAALLIIAANLKLYQAVVQPELSPTQVRDVSLVAFELLLGGLLLLGTWPRLTWSAALLAFTIFAGVSVRKSLMGSASCGCFGLAVVSPRVMVVADVAMVALLLWAGPRPARQRDSVTRFQRVARRAGVCVLSVMTISAVSVGAYALMPKSGIVADAPEHDFGVVPAEQAARCEHIFVIRNTSRHPLQITGCRSSCSCTAAELPSSPIAPGESAEVRVLADWSGVGEGQPYAQVTLRTNSFLTPRVPLVIHGTVVR